MRGVYAFLGVGPAPGVARACFSGERERFGPSDHKIWATSSVSGDSVGRGESVPVGLIAPPILDAINGLTGKLGYRPVDAEWGSPGRPRRPPRARDAPWLVAFTGRTADAATVPGAGELEQWLRSRVDSAGEEVARRWEPCDCRRGSCWCPARSPGAARRSGRLTSVTDRCAR